MPLTAHGCRPEDSKVDSNQYGLLFKLQLVSLLCGHVARNKGFDSGRFAVLHGSLKTLDRAPILLEDLLSKAPPFLIDG